MVLEIGNGLTVEGTVPVDPDVFDGEAMFGGTLDVSILGDFVLGWTVFALAGARVWAGRSSRFRIPRKRFAASDRDDRRPR